LVLADDPWRIGSHGSFRFIGSSLSLPSQSPNGSLSLFHSLDLTFCSLSLCVFEKGKKEDRIEEERKEKRRGKKRE